MARPKNFFVVDETYHCFTRGVNKQRIFEDEWDYDRFMILLLVCNGKEAVQMGNLLPKYRGRTSMIFEEEIPADRLVDILAYALMPNHIHLVMREREEKGLSHFMQRIFTAHSSYFNKKYGHSGTLFESKFKANHIDNQAYFRWIFPYTHLNPVSLIEPKWEERGVVSDPEAVREFIHNYAWSSYPDYRGVVRPENSILSKEQAPDFLTEVDDLEEMFAAYANGRV